MFVINKSGKNILVSDINLLIPYDSTNKKLIRISDTATDSNEFKTLINNGYLVITDNKKDSIESAPAISPIPPKIIPAKQKTDDIINLSKDEIEDEEEEKWKKEFFVKDPNCEHKDPFFKPENKKSKFIYRANKSNIHPKYNSLEKYKTDGIMDVEWCGPATDYGGYALMNRRCIFGLNQKKDINIHYELMPSLNDLDDATYNKLVQLENRVTGSKCIKVFGMTAPQASYGDNYKIYYTMMETYGIHKQYAERCSLCNEIWLPTQFCIDQFLKAGVKTSILKMPLGIDADLYQPKNIQPLEFTTPIKDFVFLSVFGWSYRKGYDILLKAFCEEFTSKDNVSLLISSRFYGSTEENKKDRIRSDTRMAVNSCKNKDHPHIVLFGDLMPEELMPSLYAKANCFVLPSRGEGYGLCFLEAAAMGLPVIASNVTGQTEFLTNDNAYLIEEESRLKADAKMTWISHFYEEMEFPEFGEKAINKLREHMRYVYENYSKAKKKAKKLKKLTFEKYTWQYTVDNVYNRIKNIYERLSKNL